MKDKLLEFPEGWGVLENNSSVGEVWIFSGTTQFQFQFVPHNKNTPVDISGTLLKTKCNVLDNRIDDN